MHTTDLTLETLPAALARLLAPPGATAPANDPAIRSFCDYLRCAPVEWEGRVRGPVDAPTAVFFALVLPGRTAIVMLPEPGRLGIHPGEQHELTQAGLAALRPRRLHYVQALLESDDVGRRGVLERAGFAPLATLLYLERDVRRPLAEFRAPACDWVAYAAAGAAEFAAVIQATYRESLDCPELTGLRPIEDVLESHRASGRFDPQLWELAVVGGAAAGCVLLAPLFQDNGMFELVYMGVVPEFRRRGLGAELLRRAIERCRAAGARQLAVVVDARNAPARRLYAHGGCAPAGVREAWLQRGVSG